LHFGDPAVSLLRPQNEKCPLSIVRILEDQKCRIDPPFFSRDVDIQHGSGDIAFAGKPRLRSFQSFNGVPFESRDVHTPFMQVTLKEFFAPALQEVGAFLFS
jgi:hypothetical protein